MRRLLLVSALTFAPLTLACVTGASAQSWLGDGFNWPGGSTVESLTRGMNCQSWTFTDAQQQAPVYGVLPTWLIFNEGPSPVAVRGPGSRSRDIAPFDGNLVTVLGQPETSYSVDTNYTGPNDIINARSILGSAYKVGLSGPGSARVHVCRI